MSKRLNSIHQQGFSLIEVLVALSIISGAILVLATSWSTITVRMRKTNMYNNAAVLLERKMVELEAEFKTRTLNEIEENRSGDFGKDYPNYRWAMKSRELELPDLTALILGDDKQNADETFLSMIKSMSESLSKSIKEVEVTIFIKSRKREVSFSATQYFVDFDTAVEGLGGGLPTPPPAGTQ